MQNKMVEAIAGCGVFININYVVLLDCRDATYSSATLAAVDDSSAVKVYVDKAATKTILSVLGVAGQVIPPPPAPG